MPGYANPQALNRFSYVLNNPLRYTDPTGHWVVESNNPEKEQRRNAYIHAAQRIKKKDAFSAHRKEYYLTAAAYYEAVVSEDHAENIQTQRDHLEDKRNNVVTNGWNGVDAAQSAAGDVSLGNLPDVLGSSTIGLAGIVVAGRGHTGRYWPLNQAEQIAMDKVMEDPYVGNTLKMDMQDSRWPMQEGWIKMERRVGNIKIHYLFNRDLNEFDDFKFIK